MIDETDISRERADYYEQRARQVIKNLEKRHINGQYVPGQVQALRVVMDMIPPGSVVARGDSISLDQGGDDTRPACQRVPMDIGLKIKTQGMRL